MGSASDINRVIGCLTGYRSTAAVERLPTTAGCDEIVGAALGMRVPVWRDMDLCTSNVRQAIETAAQDADRTAPMREGHHQLVLDAERKFADAGSNDWRQAHRAHCPPLPVPGI